MNHQETSVVCTIIPLLFCAVLALDIWNYCSGQQGPKAQHICNIVQSFIQLNNINNEIKQNKVLPPYLTPFVTKWHTGSSTASYSMKPFEANSKRKMLGYWALLSRATFPTV